MLRQRLQGSTGFCSRCRACEAASGDEVVVKPANAVCQVDGVFCVDDRCATHRSLMLRQRLQGSTGFCSRCRACEAASGDEVVVKPANAVCQANGVFCVDDRCAIGRSLAGSATATGFSATLLPQQTQLLRPGDRLDAAGDVQFAEQVFQVPFHGLCRDVEAAGDFFVGLALGN